MSPALEDLHPAQNRGFRELYAATRHVVNHYRALAHTLDVDALHEGAATARRLLDDLQRATRRYDLHGFPAAQNVGATAARARSGVGERFLERNQALRLAVLDVVHVKLLVAYLAELADHRGDESLAEFCRDWDKRLARVERPVRRAAIAAGADPDEAIEPIDRSMAGRLAHQAAYLTGTAGEWFDRRTADRVRGA